MDRCADVVTTLPLTPGFFCEMLLCGAGKERERVSKKERKKKPEVIVLIAIWRIRITAIESRDFVQWSPLNEDLI